MTAPLFIFFLFSCAVSVVDTLFYFEVMAQADVLQLFQIAIPVCIDIRLTCNPFCLALGNVILDGSCARGEASWGSDVDLCVLLNEDVRKLPNYAQIIHLLKGTISEEDAHSAETDIKFVIGDEWQNSGMLYFKNLRKDGIPVWQ